MRKKIGICRSPRRQAARLWASALTMSLTLWTGSAALGSTITVISYSGGGPTDMAESGATPGSMYTLGAGSETFSAIGDNSSSNDLNSNVSAHDANVADEHLDVLQINDQGGGSVSGSPVDGGQMTQVSYNQQYVAEVLAQGTTPSYQSSYDFSPQNGYYSQGAPGTPYTGSGGSIQPGGGNPPITTPEPSTIVLLVAIGAAALLERKRAKHPASNPAEQ